MSKPTAIALVTTFAATTGTSAWPNVNQAALAKGLIERINDPDKINQQGTPLCGPASVIRSIDTRDPDAYAQAAIDLFRNGHATIGKLNLHPGHELLQSAPLYGADPADWILLTSLRDSDNWFLSPAGWFGATVAGMTLPGTVEKWLRDSGYTHIINVTSLAHTDNTYSQALDAQRASRCFTKGYKVLMFIDSNMLHSNTQNDFFSMYPDHWIVLASSITDAGTFAYNDPVSFRAYTWGTIRSVPENLTKPLSKTEFLHRFYGFIAAKD